MKKQMTPQKNIFLLVLFLSLVFHGIGIYFLHDISFTPSSFSLKKFSFGSSLENDEKQKWVAEVFEYVAPPEIESLEDFGYLKPEKVEKFSSLLNVENSLALKENFLAETMPPELPQIDEGDLTSKNREVLFEEETGAAPSDFPFFAKESEEYDESERQLSESSLFNVVVDYMPRRFKPGYVFKVTLIPKQEVAFKRIRQNFFFLLDRSNSIPRARYYLNKRAVAEALSYLKPGDTFNILIFDDRISRFSDRQVNWTEESVAQARVFLEREAHGGVFAATNLYSSLGKIVPENVSEKEVNTAILLSDGDTYLSLDKQRQLLNYWSEKNKGKVSLFSLASGSGNNLNLLELLSAFNKGKLLYATKHEEVAVKLRQLMRTLEHPLGKDIQVVSVALDKEMEIHLQPKNLHLPNLYKNRPLTILGSTNRISDFTLFIQGKYYDRPFDIKKKVVFSEANSGTIALEREWTKLLAHEYYEQFFKDGKLSHLDAAKQLLAPLNMAVPFVY